MGQVQVWQMRLVVVWVARQTVGNLGFVRLQGKFWVHLASCMDVHVSMCQAESAGQLLGLIPEKEKKLLWCRASVSNDAQAHFIP